MKKVLIVVMSMLIVAVVAVTAFAANGAVFSATASATDLYRGDTVTLTVNLNSDEGATQYGCLLNFDANIFEQAGGTNDVEGATFKSVDGGLAVLFSDAKTYSGKFGTLTLKVKDDAAFGEASVTTEVSAKNGSDDVAASGAATFKFKILCKHNYGAWTESGEGHEKTCSICGDVVKANHNWNNGTVSKEAKCNEKGTMTYTCTDCGATKDEDIDMIAHTFGDWEHVDDATHKRTCTACGIEETKEHDFGTKLVAGENTHWYECVCGDKKDEADHVFDTTVWSKNSKTHWHVCACGAKAEEAEHTWDDGEITKKATESEDGEKTYTCKECGETKVEKIEKLETKSPKTGMTLQIVLAAFVLISTAAFVFVKKVTSK